MRLGIDFGGVIVQPGVVQGVDDTSADVWREQPEVFECVQRLVETCSGNVWIVSKAFPRMQARTRGWLDATDFYSRTGLERANLKFCLTREDKRIHCAEYGITHFVDDRPDVLDHLRGVVPDLFRFAPAFDAPSTPSFAMHVSTWREVLELLGVRAP